MYEIAYYEIKRLENKVKFTQKFLNKVNERLEENKRRMKHKSYYSPKECDRNNEQDNYIFDTLYYDYLGKNFDINYGDIEELINTIKNINKDNYLDEFRCTIIDKLNKCYSIEQYMQTKNKLDRTKVETTIKLENNIMNISQYHQH